MENENMETIQVSNSSMISTIDYDNDSKEMTVTFKNGNQYKYFDVPREEFEALRQSESIGSYFNKIKSKKKKKKI